MEAATQAQLPNIAILASPGMGHLIPLLQFAKRLVHHHSFSVTLIIPTNGPLSNSVDSLLESLPATINTVFLPPVNLTDIGEETRIETRIFLTMSRSIPSLRSLINSLVDDKNAPVALVVDFFGTDAFDVAIEFKISPFIFFPMSAYSLAFVLHVPKLDETVSGEYRDLSEKVIVPGSVIPIAGEDMPEPLQERKDDAYKLYLHHVKRYKLAEGLMINTFIDLEEETIKFLQEPESDRPPVYPVGPIVNWGGNPNNTYTPVVESDCLKWLDDQPDGSVLFIAFGSGGTLTENQLHELAYGLELSQHRFLWVVRSPANNCNSAYLNIASQNDPFYYLPEGFLERTKEIGLVVSSWAPQVEVLSHPSAGGFLTHCGWSSTLESIVNGIPLITWPLYAEQKLNAIHITESIKIGLRLEANENGLIERNEIARVVKCLMEGEEGRSVRSKMHYLKRAAKEVLSEGGSSTKALSELASKLKNQKNC